MWVAPNLLTFIGFMMLVVNYILLSYFDWSFYASSREHPEYPPFPWWMWFVSGAAQFLAHTLGKQFLRPRKKVLCLPFHAEYQEGRSVSI